LSESSVAKAAVPDYFSAFKLEIAEIGELQILRAGA
jgi:hypothetical protein